MTLPRLGSLEPLPVRAHPELLAPSVAEALEGWPHRDDIAVVAIDPEYADTAAMSERYAVPMADGANCVVVMGRREGQERLAACVVRADTRADVNNLVKRTLDVRKASFLAMDRAVEESGMEYGGITPLGLPARYRVLVDARVGQDDPGSGATVIIGSGVRRSKIALPGALLARAPGVELIEGLALA